MLNVKILMRICQLVQANYLVKPFVYVIDCCSITYMWFICVVTCLLFVALNLCRWYLTILVRFPSSIIMSSDVDW